ncbi:hypothetical protein [Planococcus halotolerans]|uniref:hypothetical protein n=1 Tax=Planococcus halotolerans TaxID=2233542 RepID=UPI00109237AB|nr:hypothetical protein [Planococcus halotolerans]QHJ69226.1 hypothetical protein DNR44_000580 [Planococcus halotolerans]
MKTINQFKEVINHCSTSVDNCYCLSIDGEILTLTGISKAPLTVSSALVIFRNHQHIFIKGRLDGENYETSTLENVNASNNILLGVDCRKPGNNKVYIQSGNAITKISSNLSSNDQSSLLIYWEHGSTASLTMCAYDPAQEEMLREVVTTQRLGTKNFLRAVVLQSLSLKEHKEKYNENDFIEKDVLMDKNPLDINPPWEQPYE